MLFGNLFVFIMFGDNIVIPKETRTIVLIVLSVVCALGRRRLTDRHSAAVGWPGGEHAGRGGGEPWQQPAICH